MAEHVRYTRSFLKKPCSGTIFFPVKDRPVPLSLSGAQDVYKEIHDTVQALDPVRKEKIFGPQGKRVLNERQKLLEDWEKMMKATGTKKSLQGFWIFHWWQYLNDLDDAANNFGVPPLAVLTGIGAEHRRRQRKGQNGKHHRGCQKPLSVQ